MYASRRGSQYRMASSRASQSIFPSRPAWPHFRPASTLGSLAKVLILAAIANLFYCAAYLVDIPAQRSPFWATWRRRRWILWLGGTLFALLFACYWIADEIYPFVDGAQ